KMKAYRYTSIPILNHDGNYVGTLSEGDLLWFLREKNLNLEQSEEIQITDVPRNKDNISVQVDANIEDLIDASTKQNFIPVLDDFGAFIGIVTRKDIIYYIMKKCQKN
ncbi:MAG: CBS domain-containing protein, partial [Acholeplasmataceae bacterium]|nr:CBS domain-containing protein [Acholeplasmataceae bacterium]